MSLALAPLGLKIGDLWLEYQWWGPAPDQAPTLVLLHEGLGCVGLWGDFPAKLAEATGYGVMAFSRAGYGRSSAAVLPRPLSYMHVEAQQVLPAVLDAIGFRQGALIGHSDGASIALIHAGACADPRVRACTLVAPHVFVENITIEAIERAKTAFWDGDLRMRLARWHQDVDNAFAGWNDAWLDPKFRAWNIVEYLPAIGIPLQVVQSRTDPYGTLAQVEAIVRASRGPVETFVLPAGVGHAPQREAAADTLRVVAAFVRSVLQSVKI